MTTYPVKTKEEREKEIASRLKALSDKAQDVVGAVKRFESDIPDSVKAVAEQLDGLSVGNILSLGDTKQVNASCLKQYETKPDKKGQTRVQYSLFDTWNLLPVKVIDGVQIMAKYQVVLIPEA